jgi:hypothetical protein
MLSGKLADYIAGREEILIGAHHTISSSAQKKWRALITKAIKVGELALLDYTGHPVVVGALTTTTVSKTSSKARVAWRILLDENIKEIDSTHNGKASVMEAIKWLKSNGGNRITNKGSSDTLTWLDDNKTEQVVAKKTVSSALSSARKPA